MPAHLGRTAVLAIAGAAVIVMTAQTRADVDLWGHVRFGLDILDTRSLPSTDFYSFTSNRTWINHEWLSEVVVAAVWRSLRTPGLILLKLACIVTALALIGHSLKEAGVSGHPRIMLLGLTLLGILPRVAQIRPQLFSVVLFAILIRIFVRADSGSTRALLATIPVLVFWANFHGGWLVGVATVGIWCAGEAYALRAEPQRAALAAASGLGAVAATLLNPYGVGLWRFLGETVRFGREGIREWGPVWTDPATLIVWSLFTIVSVLAILRASWPRNPATIVLPIAWGLATLRVGRLDAFFALSVVGMLSRPAASLFGRPRSEQPPPGWWTYPAALLTAAIILAVPPARRSFTCIGFFPPRWPEPEVVYFMQSHQLSGRIVTYFDWGEYAIWHLAPRLKVSIDGRRETVYTDSVFRKHLELYAGRDEGLEYIRRLNPDYIWLPSYLPAVNLLKGRGWGVLFEGSRSTLLARTDTGWRFSPAQVSGGGRSARCFPGP